MLRQLRIRLTLLYLASAIFLSMAVGGVTYALVSYYFQTTNDLALKIKMGLQFAYLGIPIPVDLYEVIKNAGFVIVNPVDSEDQDILSAAGETEEHEVLQEGELTDIYVLPLTRQGTIIPELEIPFTVQTVNSEAVSAAVKNGSDLRTFRDEHGVLVRIFTYLVPAGEKVEVIQVGRYLSSQQLVMRQLLNTMVILGGVVTIFFGFASWLLAGRTIKPSQQAWDKQQVFIANASHELRTPLTLIQAGVDLSLRKATQGQQKELLSDVLSEVHYMNKLIEDLLLLSRLDTKAVVFNPEVISLRTFLSEEFRQIEKLTSQKSIRLSLKVEDVQVKLDPLRLKQVMLIILDNAIRNTPAGGEIRLSVAPVENKVIILLSDNGSGIPAEMIGKVFDRFSKVNQQTSLDYRGSGLGLSIARSLVEAQHGSIKIYSEPGKGTKVEISFPVS